MVTDSPPDRAAEVLELAAARAPTLGAGRLICVDGPSGSGKSTFAATLSARSGAPVVAVDHLLDGWGGLPGLAVDVERLLRPLAAGRPGQHRCYDWHAEAFGGTVAVPPAPTLVLEGTGCWARRYADLVTVLVWVDAPEAERHRRVLLRDGMPLDPQWIRDEPVVLAREGTRAAADVVLEPGPA